MEVLLLFPPQWSPFQTYLSLPCLAAYLRKRGCKVEQRDLNIELYDLLLSRSHLEKLYPSIEGKYKELEAKKSLQSFERKLYFDLSWVVNTRPEDTISNVESAKRYLRSIGCFDDFKRYMSSMRTLKQALIMVSAAHSPAELRWGHYSTGTTALRLSDIMQATVDEQQNPFLRPLQEIVIPSLSNRDYLLIGLSITAVSQIIPGFTIARMLRESFPDAHITVGGNIISRFGDSYVYHPEIFELFDSIILFEGEESLYKLYLALHNDGNLSQIPNLIYKDEKGEIVENTRYLPVIGLDDLPTPDFDGLDLSLYFTPEPILPIFATRGCYWGQCSFCDQHYGHKYRKRRVANVLRDLKVMNARYGARFFQFVDDALPLSIAQRIADGLQAEHSDFVWSANFRFEPNFTKSVADNLFQAGCKIVSFGLESGSQKVLAHMKKGIQNNVARDVLGAVHQAGMINRVSVIVGFPTETEDDFYQTLCFLVEVKDSVDFIAINEFILKKFSEVATRSQDYGIRFKETDTRLDFCYHYHYSDYVMEQGMSPDVIEHMVELTKEILTEELPMYVLQQFFPLEHLLLLVSKYETGDKLRSSVVCHFRPIEKNRVKDAMERDQFLEPKLAEGVFMVSSKYDLEEVIQSDCKDPIHPKKSIFILDANKGSVTPISKGAMLILSPLDGRNNLKSVLEKMESEAGMQNNDCIEFLSDAVSRGIVIW